jgi:hypothetical protein
MSARLPTPLGESRWGNDSILPAQHEAGVNVGSGGLS